MEESARHNIWTWPCPQCGSTQKALVDNAYSNPHWECVCGYRFQYGPAFMDFYERQYEAWARGTGERPVRAVGGHLYPSCHYVTYTIYRAEDFMRCPRCGCDALLGHCDAYDWATYATCENCGLVATVDDMLPYYAAGYLAINGHLMPREDGGTE